MQDVLTLVLGGGRGARLYPLTRARSEPAVPLAGKYRLIDIPVSNCLNSGLQQIYVLTQFLSVSLHRHIASTYKFAPFSPAFVEVLPAQQTNEGSDWYQGTADALRQNLRYVKDSNPADILVLSGDQIYRMDFARLVQAHRTYRADVTIAAVPVDRERAGHLGILGVGSNDHVERFLEKPSEPSQLDDLRAPPELLRRCDAIGSDRQWLANMGIYLFRCDALFQFLERPNAPDLVHDILIPALATHAVQAYLFDGYWEDLGTIKSYHQAHLALTEDVPPFDFNSPEGIIYSRGRNLPASRIESATVRRCLVSDGCILNPGVDAERSVIGLRCRLKPNVRLRESIVIGADQFETPAERAENNRQGLPDIGIGEGSVLERAIVDKDCRIGRNVQLINQRGVRNEDGEDYAIRDGIVIIPNGTLIPDGTII
jgi:glucose-1-phosphate adenylyltransferase